MEGEAAVEVAVAEPAKLVGLAYSCLDIYVDTLMRWR